MKNRDSIKIIILGIILAGGLSFVEAQVWNSPPSNPPGGNTPAPINVSSSGQAKSGSFAVGKSTPGPNTFDVVGQIGASSLYVIGNASVGGSASVSGSVNAGNYSVYPGGQLVFPDSVANKIRLYSGYFIGIAPGTITFTSAGSNSVGITAGGIQVSGRTTTTNLTVTANAGAGRILTSNAQGEATWQAPPQAPSPSLQQINCQWTPWFRQESSSDPTVVSSPRYAPVGAYVAGIDYKATTGGDDGIIRFYYCYP